MNQDWFEMPDVKRRKLDDSVWVPLRSTQEVERGGEYGHAGFNSEFFGVGTLAVPLKNRSTAEELGWMDIGISHPHSGYLDKKKYIPADIYAGYGGFSGVHLVLQQAGIPGENSEWHLHQDLVIALGLKREGDVWVRPEEGYVEVARLERKEESAPALLSIKSSHLKDYLCARKMALYVTSYRQRVGIFEDAGHIQWPEGYSEQVAGLDRWEGRVSEIHEGSLGMRYGQRVAVFHMANTGVDTEADVPILGLPTDGEFESETWTKGYDGRKLYRVDGELWRNEWVEPAAKSAIVRGDRTTPTVFFIVDPEGNRESAETLVGGGRWLWFRPEVMSTLAHRRGGGMKWYTRDTGGVWCTPGDGVHFGVNPLGLVNVYAKDIALLPEWQQRIWCGYNVGPEGGVSEELMDSQVRAYPADTQAPEAFLEEGLTLLNQLAVQKLGFPLLKQHDQIPELILRSHRFRAVDKSGLLALAKDLARLTADSLDAAAMQKVIAPPKGEKWGSLKSLEKMLATKFPDRARAALTRLVGIYDLRLSDAHLAGSTADNAFRLAGVDQSAPYVFQGYQVMRACVDCIFYVCHLLDQWDAVATQEGSGVQAKAPKE